MEVLPVITLFLPFPMSVSKDSPTLNLWPWQRRGVTVCIDNMEGTGYLAGKGGSCRGQHWLPVCSSSNTTNFQQTNCNSPATYA